MSDKNLPDWMAHTGPKDWLCNGIRCDQETWDRLDWTRAWVDRGPSPVGNPGPYWHVPYRSEDDELVFRLYPRLKCKWWPVMNQAIVEAWGKEPLGGRLADAHGEMAMEAALAVIDASRTHRVVELCPECEGCQTANDGEMLVPCPACGGVGWRDKEATVASDDQPGV